MMFSDVSSIGIYRSPRISVHLCTSQFNIFIGDFNINWTKQQEGHSTDFSSLNSITDRC